MFEKRIKVVFIVLFLGMIAIPLFKTNFKGGDVSESEKRKLASFPKLYNEDGKINTLYSSDFETWFNDNIGFRSEIVSINANIQYYGFDVLAKNSDMYIGPNGELKYATPDILCSFQLNDLKDDILLSRLSEGFQYADDYLSERDIQFYYYQCWDKQSIYPEQFPKTVLQHGEISKTDQIVETLENRTSVNVISPKQSLIEGKIIYDTYSAWGDPTHWTPRGAYIGYLELMDSINSENNNEYYTLQESDYIITEKDLGSTLFGGIHEECMIESFEIKEPKAKLTNEKLTLYGGINGHSFYTNDEVDNDTRILIIGDSYFDSFLLDDIAESFHETILIWGDYANDFEAIIEEYNPDIVVVENAERCDRTDMFAGTMLIKKKQQ